MIVSTSSKWLVRGLGWRKECGIRVIAAKRGHARLATRLGRLLGLGGFRLLEPDQHVPVRLASVCCWASLNAHLAQQCVNAAKRGHARLATRLGRLWGLGRIRLLGPDQHVPVWLVRSRIVLPQLLRLLFPTNRRRGPSRRRSFRVGRLMLRRLLSICLTRRQGVGCASF